MTAVGMVLVAQWLPRAVCQRTRARESLAYALTESGLDPLAIHDNTDGAVSPQSRGGRHRILLDWSLTGIARTPG